MKQYILLVIGVILAMNLNAQSDALSQFDQANKDIENKKYKQGIAILETIEQQDLLSAELFQNLGNAHFLNGDLARAILYFERGLKYYPNHEVLTNNLSIAQNKVETEIFEVEDFVVIRMLKAFTRSFSTPTWAILQIIFFALILVGIYMWLFKVEQADRRKGFLITTIAVLLFLVSLIAGFQSHKSKFVNNEGIILEATQLLEGPDERSGAVKELSFGIKFEILEDIGDFYKIKLLNKQQGWIKKSLVAVI